MSCYCSGNECVLVESRRGGNFRGRSRRAIEGHQETSSAGRDLRTEARISTDRESDRSTQGSDGNEDGIDEGMCAELRNPSDALHILAQSDETGLLGSRNKPYSQRQEGLALEDYELVKTGVVQLSSLPELLFRFSRNYHPYCPLVPSYMLGCSVIQRIQKSDYFLLTVILTIATRDLPDYSLTHRYCWDYTRRLMLEILLAQPWTQRSRTIVGLILLSEWLPHIEVDRATSEEPADLFSEDRAAWSLIGLAVRHGYLKRLDQTAFRGKGRKETRKEVEYDRIVWTCKLAHISFHFRALQCQLYILRIDRYQSAWASHSGLEDRLFLCILPQRTFPVSNLLQETQREQKIMHLRYRQLSSSRKSCIMSMPSYTHLLTAP